jgi:asparagine N-glycosylation enzyme membrane subunit Stt3
VAALAALLTGGVGWEADLLAALLPASLRLRFVGRADHHVLEQLLAAGAFLVYARGLRAAAPSWRRAVLLGVLLALAFWNWSGSALNLLVLAAHVAVLHLVTPAGAGDGPARAAGELARGAGAAAVLLAASIAALGPPGALVAPSLTPLSGIAVALAALTALGAAAVAAARARDPGAAGPRRAAHLAAAAGAASAIAAALPPVRAGLLHGLTALGAASHWYAAIGEFWPLVLSGRQPWTREVLLAAFAYGAAPLVAVAALPAFVRAWRSQPERRALLSFLATWGAAMLLLGLARRRFEGYAAVPLAIWAGWGAAALAARVRPARSTAARLGALALALLPVLPTVVTGSVAEPPAGASEKFPLLRWLRGVPVAEGREGVLAPWSEGHEIRWLAGRPVVATPFGTDVDPRGMADHAAFYTSFDPAAARALVDRRRIGFVLLENPVREIATVGRMAPGAPQWAFEERSYSAGSTYALRPELFDLVVARLYFFDGGDREGRVASLPDYRLVAESGAPVEILGVRAPRYKLFEVVPGASLRVRAAPGAAVTATVRVLTGGGRTFAWQGVAVAGADGVASLRVPYATGANGSSLAEPAFVSNGRGAARVAVPAAAVVRGEALDVAL